MQFKRIVQIAFSPCLSTENTASTVSKRLSEELGIPLSFVPFTAAADRDRINSFGEDELVIIASPCYAGKLPNKILPDFQSKLKGSNTKTIAIICYGNRAYDNALAELTATEKANGFEIFAAAAFVNEHSMAHTAAGRPDSNDIKEIEDFADRIIMKIKAGDLAEISVPGDAGAAYYIPRKEDGEPAKFLKAKPLTDISKCSSCGLCARVCPTGAISPEDPAEINGTCIKCHACVNLCEKKAKYFDDDDLRSHIEYLRQNHSENNKNECFL